MNTTPKPTPHKTTTYLFVCELGFPKEYNLSEILNFARTLGVFFSLFKLCEET